MHGGAGLPDTLAGEGCFVAEVVLVVGDERVDLALVADDVGLGHLYYFCGLPTLRDYSSRCTIFSSQYLTRP